MRPQRGWRICQGIKSEILDFSSDLERLIEILSVFGYRIRCWHDGFDIFASEVSIFLFLNQFIPLPLMSENR